MEVSILTEHGKRAHVTKRGYESRDEFSARVQCRAAELCIDAGARYVAWYHIAPHNLGRFHTDGCGMLRTCVRSGNDAIAPGLHDYASARRVLGLSPARPPRT